MAAFLPGRSSNPERRQWPEDLSDRIKIHRAFVGQWSDKDCLTLSCRPILSDIAVSPTFDRTRSLFFGLNVGTLFGDCAGRFFALGGRDCHFEHKPRRPGLDNGIPNSAAVLVCADLLVRREK